MRAFNLTSAFVGGILPAMAIQGWSETMAMTPSEKSMAYQRRERAKIDALPPAERDAILAEIREHRRIYANAYYHRNKAEIDARQNAWKKAKCRAKAAARGREFGRVGIEIAATDDDRVARKAVRQAKKRAYDKARYAGPDTVTVGRFEASLDRKRDYDKARYIVLAEKKKAAANAWYAANRECAKVRSNARYHAKAKEILAQQAEKRRAAIAADPTVVERERAQFRKQYAAKPEQYGKKANERARKMRERDPERARQKSIDRYWSDPEKARARGVQDAHTRRARKLESGGQFTASDIRVLTERQKGKCLICLNPFGRAWRTQRTVDHYISLARGGTNDLSNLRLLCRKCNMSKHAKDPIEFGFQNGLLCW